MKAISFLVLLALAAVASATQVLATPYDGIYAWWLNLVVTVLTTTTYIQCISSTHLQSLLWGDGGYAFYLCLNSGRVAGGDRALKVAS